MTTRGFVATAALIMLSTTAYAQTRPAAPTLSVTGRTITASWTQQSGDGYIVAKAERGRGNWETAVVITNRFDTEHSLRLDGATEYAIRYRVRHRGSPNGPWSTTAYAETWGVPSPPTSLAVDEGDSELTFSWEPPSRTGCEGFDLGGADCTVERYQVQHRPASGGRWSTPTSLGQTWWTISGLTNGTEYEFRVRGNNQQVGWGAWAQATGTPTAGAAPTPPSAPDITSVTPGDGTIALHWDRPADSGGAAITGYKIHSTPRGGGWGDPRESETGGTNFTLNFLTNGTEYAVRVQAVNAAGGGAWSATSYAEPTADDADRVTEPRRLQLWPEDRKVTAYWASPHTGTAHGYNLQHGPAGGPYTTVRNLDPETYTGPGSGGYEIDGLTNGADYSVRVQSIGHGGYQSAWTDWETTRPGSVPGEPTNVSVQRHGDSQVRLTWSAPADNGGRPILGYDIQDRPVGQSTWRASWKLENGVDPTSTSRIVAGLENGTAYEFRVAAANETVTEDNRNWSSTVTATPRAVAPPRNVTISQPDPKDGTTWRVTWDASTDAEHIDGYRVQWARAGGGWNQGSRSGYYDVGADTMTQTVKLPERGDNVRYAMRVGSTVTIYQYGGAIVTRHRVSPTEYTLPQGQGAQHATTPVPALPLGFIPIGIGLVAWAAWRKRRHQAV